MGIRNWFIAVQMSPLQERERSEGELQGCCVGGSKVKIYPEKVDISEEVKKALSDAMEEQQFIPYLQPIYDVKNQRFCSAEALSRWKHPNQGLLKPHDYIADMITCGLIQELDYYMFEKVCGFLEQYQQKGYIELDVSCNFTRETFSSETFVDKLKEILSRYHFNYKNLILELTEDTLAGNVNIIYENIRVCREMGFKVALDDLGAGYSSLQDLCDYPIDIIKIDKHIVEKSTTTNGMALIQSLTEFAHRCNIKVVCEGVETEEERAAVAGCGCDYIQGFYYSQVLPKEAALNFFKDLSVESK